MATKSLSLDVIGSNGGNFRHKLASIFTLVLGIQVLGFSYYIWFLTQYGYLPSPFMDNKFDTFMDFFNPLYWSGNDERYTVWRSVYPPINFLFLKAVKLTFLGNANIADPQTLRDLGFPVVLFCVASYLVVPIFVLRTKLWNAFSGTEKVLLYFIFILSTPMLFALERGNLIIYTLIFLAYMLSTSGLSRAFCIAVLINLKPYLALLMVYYLIKGEWKEFWRCTLLSGILFLFTGLLVDHNFLLFFGNLVNFSQNNPIPSLREIVAMPSSISAFSSVLSFAATRPKYGLVFNLHLIANMISVIKWFVLAWIFVALYCKRNQLSNVQLFAVLLVAITNIGIWVGGYSLIFYVTLLPVFLSMRFRNVYCVILMLISAPLDIIPLFKESVGDQHSYLTDSIVVVHWTAGLGSVLVPVLNFILLATLLYEIWQLKQPSVVGDRTDGAVL